MTYVSVPVVAKYSFCNGCTLTHFKVFVDAECASLKSRKRCVNSSTFYRTNNVNLRGN